MNARRPNYLGILAGAIVMFAWGAIWYTVLGNAWLAAVGKTTDQLMRYGYAPYAVSFVASLFIAYCFDNMLWHYETRNAKKGAQVGFLTGVCISTAMMVTEYAFQGQSVALMLIDAGYGIIGFVLSGATVGALRARAARSAAAST
ncbi:MAG TPA: DUF1761 domain-containing protein [Candidatus Elarobacter sp.]|jgi:hypothetical protein|nr:DUF1761 domain-containing protein [Candidatus Elarobacter sp.]